MLQIFRSVPVVHDVHREDRLPAALRSYARDAITLGWEERLKGRARRRSDAGREFATALPRGTTLRAGDCFALDVDAVVVVVVERAEPVLVVTPRTGAEWGLFAYYIGNSHQPVMIVENGLVCADLVGMEQVLEQHAIPFSRDVRPFTPVGGLLDHRHAD
jgi:urease accessory protein